MSISLNASTDDTTKERTKQLLDQQRFGYAMGYQIAQNLRRQGVEVHVSAFSSAIRDYFENRKPRLAVKDMEALLKTQKAEITKRQSALAQKNQEAGRAFLAENRKKDGIQEFPSGLQYRVIEPGKGSKPQLTDTVAVHYRGSLLNGKEFDSSYIRGEPSTFQLTNAKAARAWREVLPRMQEGAKWQIFVPPELGYGKHGAGSVGPNETLIMEIDLLKVNRRPE